jgi:hypothetical protein
MKRTIRHAVLTVAFLAGASVAWAKLPPPPPLDEKGKAAAEEKKVKDAEAAAKAKAALVEAEDKAVKNYHGNMRKAGKPIPKPTPVVAAAPPAAPGAPAAAKPGDKAAPAAPAKPAAKKS